MKNDYVQEGKYTFLRIEAIEEADSRFEVRMITNNQPERLLKMVVTRVGGQSFFDYNVTGLSSLSSLETEVSTYLFSVVSGLERLGEVLPEYLLSADELSLEPEHIFVRKETGQIYFCYLPGKAEPFQKSVRAMMEFFMKNAAPADPEEVLLLYGLYQRSREEDVGPASLAALWREKKASRPRQEELPMIEEPTVEFPDEDVYAELGMEPPKAGQRAFGKALSSGCRRGTETELQPRESGGAYRDPGRSLTEGHEGAPAAEENRRKGFFEFLQKRKKESTVDQGALRGGTLQEKIGILWKKHKGEVAVGAVVVVGAVLILIR